MPLPGIRIEELACVWSDCSHSLSGSGLGSLAPATLRSNPSNWLCNPMLRWRLAISLILIPLLALLFYADAKSGPMAIGLFVLCSLLALRAAWELIDLFRSRLPQLHGGLLLSSICAIVYAAWWPHFASPEEMANKTDVSGLTMTFVGCQLLIMAAAARRFDAPGQHMATLATEWMILAYVGLFLGLSAQLRWVAGHDAGYLAIGSLVICVKGGDTGAYTFGKLFGGPKMTPVLSPKKTWAGAVGAVLGSTLFGLLWFLWAKPWFLHEKLTPTWWALLLYCMILGVAGIIGDLCESLIKRDLERKDSAPLLPGFGGLLDMIDSILFAGPVAYGLWQALPLFK